MRNTLHQIRHCVPAHSFLLFFQTIRSLWRGGIGTQKNVRELGAVGDDTGELHALEEVVAGDVETGVVEEGGVGEEGGGEVGCVEGDEGGVC